MNEQAAGQTASDPSYPDLADRMFSCTFGSFTDTEWPDRRVLPWTDLTGILTRHELGIKEGPCIVPAIFRGQQRRKADADRIDAAFLDSDSGATLEEIITAVRRAGWAAVISSSHSHRTTTTKANIENWRKFRAERPSGAEAAYLTEVKGMLPRITAGAVVEEETAEFVWFRHEPCPKYRIVIPLLKPWQAIDYATQDLANAAWKQCIEALASALGLQHDQACTDTSRLFFLPRIPAGGPPPETEIVSGMPCDIFALAAPIDEPLFAGATAKQSDRQRNSGNTASEYTDPATGELFNLRNWARDYGDRFLVVAALRKKRPAAMTGRVADQVKVHTQCPNEDAHTEPGADGATFVTDAGKGRNRGFVIHCRHAHCDGRDRMFFIRKMLEKGWLQIDDLTAPEFLIAQPEDNAGTNSVGADLPAPFFATVGGIWFQPPAAKDAPEPSPSWICAPFTVVAEARDEVGESWGLLLEWNDRDGAPHQWSVPRRLLHADGNLIAAELEHAGLAVGTGRAAHDLLKRLLGRITTPKRKRCVTRSGWHAAGAAHVYVLPGGETFGATGSDVILQTDRAEAAAATRARGTLQEWQDGVARYAVGNHRLALFMAAAFAAPLLDIVSEPSGGLHMHGGSQTGKTTALACAASVWGRADTSGQIRTWRATSNGMEGVAAETCDALLALDEIGMVDPKEAGEIVYSLANESGKARASRDGSARARRTWRTVFLSTGEVSLSTKMTERGGASPMAGQDVRLANLPAEAGARMGVFQQLFSKDSPAMLAQHLRAASRQYYGTAARAFLTKLATERNTDMEGLTAFIAAQRQAFHAAYVPAGADGQVISVAGRFGLIAVAGELARAFGVVPWPEGEATRAAAAGLKAWLGARGGAGAAEDAQAISTVRRFIEAHEESRFTQLMRAPPEAQSTEDEARASRQTIMRVGFRREVGDGWEFLVFPESWKSEVCKGLDPARAAEALHAAGYLDKGDGKNWPKKHRVPGLGLGRFYTVRSTILQAEDAPTGDAKTMRP